jgi:hypothetical protein
MSAPNRRTQSKTGVRVEAHTTWVCSAVSAARSPWQSRVAAKAVAVEYTNMTQTLRPARTAP